MELFGARVQGGCYCAYLFKAIRCGARSQHGRNDQLVEVFKVHAICVRDGAEFHFVLAPVNPLIALPRTCARRTVRFPCRPDEYIDCTSVTLVDEHRNSAAFNNVQAPTLQSETLVRKIADRNSKPSSAVEPFHHKALIVGSHTGHVAWL